VLELMGVHEIAELMRVSRQRADKIIATHKDFPAPVAKLKGGRIWRSRDVTRWVDDWNDRGRRPKPMRGRSAR